MSRDYAAEMRAVIDAEATGRYAAPVVAAHIVEKLTETDPALLDGWLHFQAVSFVRDAINSRDASVRSHNRMAVSRSVFRRAAEDFEAGDDEALTTDFLGERYVIEDGSKIPLGQMFRPERRFVADDFAAAERENGLRKAFILAVDKKCGARRTDEVFDEDKLRALWESLCK